MPTILLPLARGADGGEVEDHLLGVLSLSDTRLASDKDGLVDAGVALVGSSATPKMWGQHSERLLPT